MLYSYHLRLPFTCTDARRQLTVPGALDLMQDASDAHTLAVVSPEYLANSRRIWILNSWLVYFDRPAAFREELTMSTWSAGARRMFAKRNFLLQNQAGETCLRARTFWFLVDSETLSPVRITPEDISFYESSPALELNDPGRKIFFPAACEEEPPFPVRRYMLDAYRHVNNVWYVRLAMEYLPEKFPVRRLRAEYRSAAHLGDTFYPRIHREPGLVTVALANESGTPYAVVEFSGAPEAEPGQPA